MKYELYAQPPSVVRKQRKYCCFMVILVHITRLNGPTDLRRYWYEMMHLVLEGFELISEKYAGNYALSFCSLCCYKQNETMVMLW